MGKVEAIALKPDIDDKMFQKSSSNLDNSRLILKYRKYPFARFFYKMFYTLQSLSTLRRLSKLFYFRRKKNILLIYYCYFPVYPDKT